MTPIVNEFTKHNPLAQEMSHEMNKKRTAGDMFVLEAVRSKILKGCQDLDTLVAVEEQSGATFTMTEFVVNYRRPPTKAQVNGCIIPVKGIMAMLAVSRLLCDTDCLGDGFKNAGFVVQTDTDGKPVSVRAVKIDMGYSFNFEGPENAEGRMKDKRDIQFGNNQQFEIEFERLLPEQRSEFDEVFRRGMQSLCKNRSTVRRSFIYEMFWQGNDSRCHQLHFNG